MAKKNSTEIDEANKPAPRAGETSVSGLRPVLTVAERRALGKEARKRVPLKEHAVWKPDSSRPDPVALLQGQDTDRIQELLPVRYGRMSQSPFAFLRGSAVVMASDLATSANTGITSQLCGDAHISNFGFYASPERQLIFDINDFDETLPGPWEWDLKRLVTSAFVASRSIGLSKSQSRDAARGAVEAYQTQMSIFAELNTLEIWYHHPTVKEIHNFLRPREVKLLEQKADSARKKGNKLVAERLSEIRDGKLELVESPPLVVRLHEQEVERLIHPAFRQYFESLSDHHRELLDRYQYSGAALRVVGVGSVGTRCYVLALTGRDVNDPLFLQLKEAGPSVLSAYLPATKYENQAHRVVAGQRFTQWASDIFLGWIRMPDGREFYIRQLKDMKASVDVSLLNSRLMMLYVSLCGALLARAHARTGDPILISAYLGKGDAFADALVVFAEKYADQTERDFERLQAAVRSGQVAALTGI